MEFLGPGSILDQIWSILGPVPELSGHLFGTFSCLFVCFLVSFFRDRFSTGSGVRSERISVDFRTIF